MITLNSNNLILVNEELQNKLDLSKSSIYRHIRKKQIPVLKLGYKIFVEEKNLMKIFDSKEGK